MATLQRADPEWRWRMLPVIPGERDAIVGARTPDRQRGPVHGAVSLGMTGHDCVRGIG